MAGLGQRFVDAGYRQPKPLIDVDGLPMVVRAVHDLPPTDRKVFIVHPDHVAQHRIDRTLRQHFPAAEVITAPGLTAGQACSVRLASDALDPNQPVLVAACDNSHLYSAAALYELLADPGVECAIWTYRHDFRVLERPTAHGWVRLWPGTMDAERISCKTPISNTPLDDHAITGCFWFRTARKMLDGINALVAANERVNGEFYLDSVPNMIMADGRRVVVFEVEKYIGWGTPRDLEDYVRWQRYFARPSLARLAG